VFNTGSPPDTGGNVAPKATLAVAAGPAPNSVVLTATATDLDGFVAAVDFFMDGNKIATITKPPVHDDVHDADDRGARVRRAGHR
jgi:hypothetical protein